MKRKPLKIMVTTVCKGVHYAEQWEGTMRHGYGKTQFLALVNFLREHGIVEVAWKKGNPKKPSQ